jgi:hypothetical protein
VASPAPVNPAVLNALTLKWGRERANLDDQQNRYKINYNSALDKMRRNYGDTTTKATEGFADRGMALAGPARANAVKLQDEYNRQQGDASTMYNTNLATIARNRIIGEQEFKNNKLLAALGYTTG